MEDKDSNGKRHRVRLNKIIFAQPYMLKTDIKKYVREINKGRIGPIKGVRMINPSTLQEDVLVGPKDQAKVYALNQYRRKTVEVIDITTPERKEKLSEERKELTTHIGWQDPINVWDYTPNVSKEFII